MQAKSLRQKQGNIKKKAKQKFLLNFNVSKSTFFPPNTCVKAQTALNPTNSRFFFFILAFCYFSSSKHAALLNEQIWKLSSKLINVPKTVSRQMKTNKNKKFIIIIIFPRISGKGFSTHNWSNTHTHNLYYTPMTPPF